MLVLRFQRIGKKGQAYFRIVATEHTKKPLGEFLELLGSYDPHKKDLKVKKERIEYWMSKGAQLSPTVQNLLINKKIISGDKKQSWKPKVKEKPAAAAAPAKADSAPAEPAAEAPAEKPAE
jgi:small subunit ribosomal protein S16